MNRLFALGALNAMSFISQATIRAQDDKKGLDRARRGAVTEDLLASFSGKEDTLSVVESTVGATLSFSRVAANLLRAT